MLPTSSKSGLEAFLMAGKDISTLLIHGGQIRFLDLNLINLIYSLFFTFLFMKIINL